MTIQKQARNWVEKKTKSMTRNELCRLFDNVRNRKLTLLRNYESYRSGFYDNAEIFYEIALDLIDKEIYKYDHNGDLSEYSY